MPNKERANGGRREIEIPRPCPVVLRHSQHDGYAKARFVASTVHFREKVCCQIGFYLIVMLGLKMGDIGALLAISLVHVKYHGAIAHQSPYLLLSRTC